MTGVKIAVIGLGYVGLPLAVEFSRYYPVVGYDIKRDRVEELRKSLDNTLEVESSELIAVLSDHNTLVGNVQNGLFVSCESCDIDNANYYIVTVPTPTDKYNRPDLSPLIKACELVGRVLKHGDTVIFESTVYPGATEEDCVPVLKRVSGLEYAHTGYEPSGNRLFYCGYSPERINPGDKEHTLVKIKKITSGSTDEAAERIDKLYRSIILAGTHKAPSIKVAEAAKVIENSQRDINIAFVNELAMIFNRLGIDTLEVLEAAGTKWNFLPFRPGLVGGHCIGVDPFYLAQKAQEVGYHPEIILAGRRLNDNMGQYVASEIIKLMISRNCCINGGSVLVLGITFKENCPDIRNTRVIDIVRELEEYGVRVEIYDPWADPADVRHEYGVECLRSLDSNERYEAVVLAVAHEQFRSLDICALGNGGNPVVYDVKGLLKMSDVDGRL